MESFFELNEILARYLRKRVEINEKIMLLTISAPLRRTMKANSHVEGK